MPILVDASSPAVASGTGATTSTAAFSPPGNSIMVAFCQSDANNGSLDEQATVSGTGQTWTLLKRHNGADNAIGSTVEVWVARVDAAPGSITVDLVSNKGAVAKRLFVRVFTGAAGTGATGSAGGNSVTYTSTVVDSLGWSVGLGNNTTAIAGAGQSIKDSATGFDGGDGVFACARDAYTPVPGTTVTMSVSSIVSVHHVAVEVVPPPVSVTRPPLPPWLLDEILAAAGRRSGDQPAAAGTAETGTATAVATASGTAVKVAALTGRTTAATTAAGTARKTALPAGTTTSPATARATATKQSADTGRTMAAATGRATASKTAADTGRTTAAATAAGTATSSLPRAQTGTTSAAVRCAGTARKTAATAGTATAPVRCTATAAKTTTAAGASRAIACAAGTALHRAMLAGRTVAAATSSAPRLPGFVPALVGLDSSGSGSTTDGRAAAQGNAGGTTGTTGQDGTLNAAGGLSGGTTATGQVG